MDLLSKLMGNIDMNALQGMMPQQKIIEDYKILVCGEPEELELKANGLIQQGYEPIGFLIKYQYGNYIREFIKYKALTTVQDVKE